MVVKCVENFLQPFEKKFQPKKGGFVRKSQPVLNPMFFKNQDIFTFPGIKSDWFVVWSWFLYWREELVWADLPNTLNMVVKCVENFLQPFEKKFYPKKQGLVRRSQPVLRPDFRQKSRYFHFSWHIIRLVCRMTLIFLLTWRTSLSGPSR